MDYMFVHATKFNQNLNSWNVAQVTSTTPTSGNFPGRARMRSADSYVAEFRHGDRSCVQSFSFETAAYNPLGSKQLRTIL